MIPMRKKRVVLFAFLAGAIVGLGATALAFAGEGLSLTFKLGGGAGYLLNGAGDIERVRLGYQNRAADWLEPNHTSTFDWKKLSIVPDFRFEAILRLGESFGLGLGTAYLAFDTNGAYSLDHYESASYPTFSSEYTFSYDYAQGFKLTAIPIFLNFYYFFPMDGTRVYVFGGPGVYFGSLTHDETMAFESALNEDFFFTWDFAYTTESNENLVEKMKCTAFGFQGGFGLEIPLSPVFSFGIEAYGRYANFSNWKGDWTWTRTSKYEEYSELLGWWKSVTGNFSDSGSGILYFDEKKWWHNDRYYGEAFINDSAPSGSSVRNVREAGINLNSVGILASILIHI